MLVYFPEYLLDGALFLADVAENSQAVPILVRKIDLGHADLDHIAQQIYSLGVAG